jgi:hypothetical protein
MNRNCNKVHRGSISNGPSKSIIFLLSASHSNFEQVWGGIRIYLANKMDALYSALHDFTANQKDPKAAIIFTHAQPLGLTTVYMLFFFYDGPTVPAGAFGQFLDIPPTINMCKTRSYTDMASKRNRSESSANKIRWSWHQSEVLRMDKTLVDKVKAVALHR